MASDEQFSLCWNNFHSNMSTGFHGLLSRGDLVDVTLAAEGRLLQAHKLVLSVCSPYFQEMFKMNPTQHPIVFLKDVSYNALRDLLQFMYQGEVNVKQEELASFISTAEQLQVKGLTGNNDDSSTPASKPKPSSRPGPRSSQQRQSLNKAETDLDSKPITPVALKRPNRPSITPSNPQSSQPAPAKRKCVDPLEAGPSGANSKDDFVTIPDDEESTTVAPKMEPEFVNESLWEDDEDGTNNDDGNFGEDDSNMEMSGFGDGSVTGDTAIACATGGESGAVGDAQGGVKSKQFAFQQRRLVKVVTMLSNQMVKLNKKVGLQLGQSEKSFDPLAEDPFAVPDFLTNLPVKDDASFCRLNDQLKSSENKQAIIKNLAGVGGRNVKILTTNLLRRILLDDVAEQYSLTGKKMKNSTKKPFIATEICEIIFEISKKIYDDVTKEKLKEITGDWLNQAKFRTTRRAERQKKSLDSDISSN